MERGHVRVVSTASRVVGSSRRMVRHSWLWRMLRDRLGVRMSRYGVASLVALGVSEVVYLSLYVGLAWPGPAGLVAGILGGIPKFVLCRWWAWDLRGKGTLISEVLSYVLVASVTGWISGQLTSLADGLIIANVAGGLTRTFLIGLTFLLSSGAVFLLKFVLFDKLVFTGRGGMKPPRQEPPQPDPVKSP